MENEQVSDQSQQESSASTETQKKQDTVAWETHKRLLGEKKRFEQQFKEASGEAEELRNFKKAYEEQKALEEGRQAEVIEDYKAKVKNLEGKLQEKDRKYAFSTIEDQIRTKAVQSGCSNPEKLIKLMESDDFATLKDGIGDNYKLNPESLEAVMSKLHQENSFLFKTNKTINDLPPTNKAPAQKTFKEMNEREKGKAFSSALESFVNEIK